MRGCRGVPNLSNDPTRRRVARRLQGTFQELIGPTHTWPTNIRNAVMVSQNLDNTNRLKVFWFLCNNGVNPDLVIEWAENKFQLDGQAMRHMQYLKSKLDDAGFHNNHYYFHLATRAYVSGFAGG